MTSIPDEVVLGVDTHKDVHVAAVLSPSGRLLGTGSFPATAAGYADLTGWADGFGLVVRAGVEGTGSYGAALSRHLRSRQVRVFEVTWPDRAARRRYGKSDEVDAVAAAQAVISGRASATPKTGEGSVAALRLFKLAKDSAVKARTQALNQLRAVLIGADPVLREQLAHLPDPALLRHCADLDEHGPDPVACATAVTLRLLAVRAMMLTEQIKDLKGRLAQVLTDLAPDLLALPGVGPDSAAALLITMGDNPERISSEAGFAALCGVSPVQHSSGKQQHHRLNRGGDRAANAALYRIVQSRLRCDQRTKDYLARRTREGKTRREIIRCLKRYVAREIFTLIQTT